MNLFLILCGKLITKLSTLFNLGSGSTWPGHIAMETNSKFVKQILKKNPNLKVVLIAGTNGKTTTSLLLQKMLESHKLKVFRNEAGANLLNGIASSIISNSNLFGKITQDVAIFEVDENNLDAALLQIKPAAILLLNLFRDQLDRYGEVNSIAERWQEALNSLDNEITLITNGDDPKLVSVAQSSELNTSYFGLARSSMNGNSDPYDVDFTYCPQCKTKLTYDKVSFSHLGNFVCKNCGFTNPETQTFTSLPHPLFGKYNVYNVNAAALVAQTVFDITLEKIQTAIKDFKPAFGRQETITYKNRNLLMLLSKNPAGFNQSIEAILDTKKKGNVLLLLNDRIPDGRDVSWIWDVDFEKIPKESKIFISGDRAYDMGLRIKYLGDRKIETNILTELSSALDVSIENTKPDETLFILPTYSAMLDVRKLLTGKKIL